MNDTVVVTLLVPVAVRFLLRLEVGCRKMTRLLWREMIKTHIRYFGCVMLEPRYRCMSR